MKGRYTLSYDIDRELIDRSGQESLSVMPMHSQNDIDVTHQEIESLDQICNKIHDEDQFEILIDQANNGLTALHKFQNCYANSKCRNYRCKNQTYRLIILEVDLPILDGLGASTQILEHAKEKNFHTELVALKKTSNKISNEKCLEHGFRKLYNKPIRDLDIQEMLCINFWGMSQQ